VTSIQIVEYAQGAAATRTQEIDGALAELGWTRTQVLGLTVQELFNGYRDYANGVYLDREEAASASPVLQSFWRDRFQRSSGNADFSMQTGYEIFNRILAGSGTFRMSNNEDVEFLTGLLPVLEEVAVKVKYYAGLSIHVAT